MKRISRRNFLKAAGVGAAALGLAACGSSSSSTGSSTTSSAAASATPAEDVTIKVAAIETAYGSEMWQKVTEAFTAQTGIKVELTTDKNLEDVIGPSMQGGDYPDVIHLATGREAALTEQFIKGNLIADITDVLSMTVPGESKKVSEKIAGGFTDTSLTNPYGDGKTYTNELQGQIRPNFQRICPIEGFRQQRLRTLYFVRKSSFLEGCGCRSLCQPETHEPAVR